MITQDIKTAYHRAKWALFLRGLLGLALGIFILARPLDSVAAFALVIALWALMDGIVAIVHAAELRQVVPHWWLLLLAGVVSVGFGVAALYYYPALSLTFAVVWSAWWLMTAGALAIWLGVQERSASLPWGWTFTLGIVTFAAGILAIVYPGATLAALMAILAAFGIISGIVLLIGAGKLQSFEHDVRHTMTPAART